MIILYYTILNLFKIHYDTKIHYVENSVTQLLNNNSDSSQNNWTFRIFRA